VRPKRADRTSPPDPVPTAAVDADTVVPPPEPVTMFALFCPCRKNGAPVVGSFGAQIREVVIFDMREWKRLCEQVPQLATTQFRVGRLE
jgi:hypothetical protein